MTDQIWHTNRSKYEQGTGHCRVARYFGQHFQGWGISPLTVEMPLATGGLVHHIVEGLNRSRTGDCFPTTPAGQAITIVNKWCNKYVEGLSAKGFADPDEAAERAARKWRLQEQATLAAGLGMVWWKYGMENFFEDYSIISIEQEYPVELPWGIPGWKLIHEVRPDLVCRRNSTKRVTVFDFKSEDYINEQEFRAQWVDSIQMAMQSHAVEKALGEEVDYAVIGLEKGQRKSDYNSLTKGYDGPRRQQSPLCYMYFLQGAPPMTPHGYAPKYQYMGSDGKKHNLPKLWEKTPVWELPGLEDYPLYGARALRLLELMEENWTPAQLLCYAGPYPVNRLLLSAYLDSVATEEEWWFRRIMEEDHGDKSIFSVFPASFECINAWGRKCQFHEICYRETNAADDPLGSGRYQVRRPHHQLEAAAQKEAGVHPAAQWDSEEG